MHQIRPHVPELLRRRTWLIESRTAATTPVLRGTTLTTGNGIARSLASLRSLMGGGGDWRSLKAGAAEGQLEWSTASRWCAPSRILIASSSTCVHASSACDIMAASLCAASP